MKESEKLLQELINDFVMGTRRYSRDDLELITRSKGGNAYHSAEEWVTDEEATGDYQMGDVNI